MSLLTPLPDFRHLKRRLEMSTVKSRILLDGKRMALIHGHALGLLRREMIASIGVEATRGLFTRMGFASGRQDAETARRLSTELEFPNAFLFGPHFYTLEGLARTEVVSIEIDLGSGCYRGEFHLFDSLEVEFQLRDFGMSGCPACWMQTGYASGYMTTFIGHPIPHRETKCQGKGDEVCLVVGKPLDEWGEEFEEARFYGHGTFEKKTFRRPPTKQRQKSIAERSLIATSPTGTDAMIGFSPGFTHALKLVRKVARTAAPVLLLGETGVGKELFARTLHVTSQRGREPFVAVNCAAIPESLLEAELFGVDEGAYTGAHTSRPGRFERAHRGTLFLDEIGSLPWAAQGSLLRALQTGEIERVGSTRARQVDVRIVAATNEDLENKIRSGSFRSDLFYRLNVFPVRVPPLRERRTDLPHLIAYFLQKFSQIHGRRDTGVSEGAMRILLERDYPGNVRELANTIERAIILADGDGPLQKDLFSPGTPLPGRGDLAVDLVPKPSAGTDLGQLLRDAVQAGEIRLDDLERTVMKSSVDASSGNLSAAARRIGVTRRRLAYRLRDGSA